MNLCRRLMDQDQYVALTRTIEELHSNDDNKIGTDNLSSQQCTSIFHHCFSMCWTLKSKDAVEEWTLCQWQSIKSYKWQIEPYSTASLERPMLKLHQVITNKWHETTRMNGCWLNPAKSKMLWGTWILKWRVHVQNVIKSKCIVSFTKATAVISLWWQGHVTLLL